MLDWQRGGGGISGGDNELDLVSHVGGNLAIDLVPYGSVAFSSNIQIIINSLSHRSCWLWCSLPACLCGCICRFVSLVYNTFSIDHTLINAPLISPVYCNIGTSTRANYPPPAAAVNNCCRNVHIPESFYTLKFLLCVKYCHSSGIKQMALWTICLHNFKLRNKIIKKKKWNQLPSKCLLFCQSTAS